MELILVKLGGSLITDKSGEEAVRADVLERLAREIAEVRGESRRYHRELKIVLGHGSGSFGHVAASRYGLGEGLNRGGRRGSLEGVSVTQDAAAQLHRRVVRALLDAGETPFSVAPSSTLVARHGRIARGNLSPLRQALDLGLLPVVYGDVIADLDWGMSICSTEAALYYLVGRFRGFGQPVDRVLWLGSTDGVYDNEGRTVPVVSDANYHDLLYSLGAADGTDVTGGMHLRLQTARELARRGVESWIFDGRTPGNLAAALRGTDVPATRVPAD